MQKNIQIVKHINKDKNNRVEYLFANFDCFDGNDYIAKLFSEEYGFTVEEKIDGWWYSIVRINLQGCEYELLWHEDTGNAIYCSNQKGKENDILQQRLKRIVYILNTQINIQ